MCMSIAVVGSGIAGLGAAWALSRNHEVVVFEPMYDSYQAGIALAGATAVPVLLAPGASGRYEFAVEEAYLPAGDDPLVGVIDLEAGAGLICVERTSYPWGL